MSSSSMKSILISIYIIFALITAGFIGIMIFEGIIDEGGVEAVPIIVDPNGNGDYTTIQAAINGATAGNTIRVWEGTYQAINVNKVLTIIGNGTTNTTITSASAYRVRFTANGATLSGFRITRTTAGNTASAVYLNNIQNTHVYNVNVTWCNKGFDLVDSQKNLIEQSWVNQSSQGVYMSNSHGNEIRNITFTNSNLNIDIFDSNSNIFDNNTFKTYGIGIRTSSSDSNTFSNNFFYSNTTRWATNLQYSNQTTIVGNEFINSGILIVNNPLHFWFAHTIADNTVNGKPVIFQRNVTNNVTPVGAGQVILANCSNVTVENQDVSFGAIGIHAEYSDNLTIRNNTSDYNFEDGIRLLKSEDCNINNNSCNSSILGSGINIGDFVGADRNLIKDNICNSNYEYGIFVRGSLNVVSNNRCNLSGAEDGIYVFGTYNKILNNFCEWNRYGIALNYADWNTVDNNVCPNNLNGISLFTSSYNSLDNNTCNSNTAGIDVGGFSPGSNYNTISNNTANSNNNGIYLSNSDYSAVENNTCKFNSFTGIAFGIAMYNIIHKNTINSNNRGLQGGNLAIRSTYSDNTINFNTLDGVYCTGLQQSKFVGNNVSNNNVGLNMDVSRWNTFYDNIISFNALKGIVIDFGSNDNLLYHNNIISNPTQAVDNVSSTWYNSNQEGNYWSDYAGSDDGSGTGKHAVAGDGIGDTLIPHLGLDDYPFISSFYWWRITGVPVLNLVDINPSDADYDLNWNSITNAIGYELHEDTSLAFSSPVTAYMGPGLAVNILNQSEGDYYYRARAYNKFAGGPWSNVVNITVDLAPTAPENLTATNISGTDVELNWNPNPETDIQFYKIYINAPGSGASGPFNPLSTVSGTTNTFTLNDLQEETTYYFVITAMDNLYESAQSNVCAFTTLDESAPELPVGLEATALSSSQIDLAWNASTALDLAGYFIYMNESGSGSSGNFVLFNTTIGSATSFSATGLAEEVTYYFKIIAFDEVPNNSSFSNVASATTLDGTPPTIPTGLAVTNPTINTLTVTWSANSDSDLVGYMLYRSEYQSGSYTQLFTEPFDDLEFLDTNLTIDTTYYYKLKAVDDVNLSSEFSEPASGTTLNALPPVVTGTLTELSIPEDTYDDTSLNLYDIFTDDDSETLIFSVSGQSNINVLIYPSNGTVVLEPGANWNGQEDLIFYASDSDFPEVPYTITIIVTPVNDPPGPAQILKPNDGSEVDEGTVLEFIGSCRDPDEDYGDELTFKWNSSKSGELGEGAKLTDVVLEPGEHTITLHVSDKAGLTSTASITLTIKGDGITPGNGKDDDTKDTGDDEKDAGALGDNNSLFAILAIVIIIIIVVILFFVLRKRRGAREDGGETEIAQPTPPPESREATEEMAVGVAPVAPQPEVPEEPMLPEGVEPEGPPEPAPAEPVQIERSMLETLPKTGPVSEEVRATASVVVGEPVTVIENSNNI